MLDPITSLLAACANCNQPAANLDQPTAAVCDTGGRSHQNQFRQTRLSISCVSPPETAPALLSLKSGETSATASWQQPDVLNQTNSVARPSAPESATWVSWSKPASTQSATDGVGNEVLQLNSQGQAVSRLQTQLRQLGYYAGAIDGIYGPQTKTAVARFQRSKGLAANGVVGADTWLALQSALQSVTRQPSAQMSPAAMSSSETPPAEFLSPSPVSSESSRSTPQPAQSAAVAETQVASPSDADTSTSKSASPQFRFHYLWILGWVIVYGYGWFFILKDTVKEIKGFHFMMAINQKPQAKDVAQPAIAQPRKVNKATEHAPKIIIHHTENASHSATSVSDAAIDSQPAQTGVAVMQHPAKIQEMNGNGKGYAGDVNERTSQPVNEPVTDRQNGNGSNSTKTEQWVLYDPWQDEIADVPSEQLEVVLADGGQIQPLQNVFIVAPRPTSYSRPRSRKPASIYGTPPIRQRMKTG